MLTTFSLSTLKKGALIFEREGAAWGQRPPEAEESPGQQLGKPVAPVQLNV